LTYFVFVQSSALDVMNNLVETRPNTESPEWMTV